MFETVCVFFLVLMNASTAVSSNVTESTNNSQGDQRTAAVAHATSTLEDTVIESSSNSPLQTTTVTSHHSQIRSTATATAKIPSMEGISKSTAIEKTSTSSVQTVTSTFQTSQSPTSSTETSYPPMKDMTSSAVVTSSKFEEISTSTQPSSDVTSRTLKTTTSTPNKSSSKPFETMTLSTIVTTAQITSSNPSAVVTSFQGINLITSFSSVIVATPSHLSAISKTTQIFLASQGKSTKETEIIATGSLGITTAIKFESSATSSEQAYHLESTFRKIQPTASTSGLATQTTESSKDLVTKASPIASALVPTDETVTTQLPEGQVTTKPGQAEASTSTGRKALLVTIYVVCAVLFIAVIVLVVVLYRSIKKKRSKNLRTQESTDVEDGNVFTLRAVHNNVSKGNLAEEAKEEAEESKPLLDCSGVGNEEPNVVQNHDMQRDPGENSKPEELSSEKTDADRNDDN